MQFKEQTLLQPSITLMTRHRGTAVIFKVAESTTWLAVQVFMFLRHFDG